MLLCLRVAVERQQNLQSQLKTTINGRDSRANLQNESLHWGKTIEFGREAASNAAPMKPGCSRSLRRVWQKLGFLACAASEIAAGDATVDKIRWSAVAQALHHCAHLGRNQ